MEGVSGGNLKDKHHLEILNYDESIISKYIFKQQDTSMEYIYLNSER